MLACLLPNYDCCGIPVFEHIELFYVPEHFSSKSMHNCILDTQSMLCAQKKNYTILYCVLYLHLRKVACHFFLSDFFFFNVSLAVVALSSFTDLT